MPVQVDVDQFVLFEDSPSSYYGCEDRRTDVDAVLKQLNLNVKKSNIKLDGGNIVQSRNRVIITERILKENLNYSTNALIKELEELLQAEVILIPTEPYDDLGHADGMVNLIDDANVLVNDYVKTDASKSFQKKLHQRLKSNGFSIFTIPYTPDSIRYNPEIASAMGVYINYLQIGNQILFPFFGTDKADFEAFHSINELFNGDVIPIHCAEIAKQGGVLNCMTWPFQTTN